MCIGCSTISNDPLCPRCLKDLARADRIRKANKEKYIALSGEKLEKRKKRMRDRVRQLREKYEHRGPPPQTAKRCPKCNTVKDPDEFYIDRGRIDGLTNYCKSCSNL